MARPAPRSPSIWRSGAGPPIRVCAAWSWPGRKSPDAPTPLWVGQRGALSESGIWRVIRSLVEAEAQRGLIPPEVSPHDLRHTFAQGYLKDHPGDLVGLAQLLGHSNINTTAIYSGPLTWGPPYVATLLFVVKLCDVPIGGLSSPPIAPRVIGVVCWRGARRGGGRAGEGAGLPILHVPWRPHYDAEELAAAIRRAAGLPAPAPAAPAPAIPTAPRARLDPAMYERALSAPPGPRWACRRCGAEVGAAAKHCPGCGATLEL